MARIGIIGDVHEPVAHPGYLAFCQDVFTLWQCDQIIFIGDVIDHHAISFHARHPEMPGPQDEAELTHRKLRPWVETFPNAKVCIGNHDERVIRLAEATNIPKRYIRDYAEVWDTPGWEWVDEINFEGVHYFHGTGCGGEHPAFNAMKKMSMSTVMGHVHTAAGVKWMANPNTRMFGMDTGCGIDDRAMAFAYGRHMKRRSILGCGVVVDGVPYHEIMPCGRGERYDRARFEETL
jgi:predicted phosphodiesterase